MKDDEALLAAICASPEDDAPRLVYADLLQGRGDARGELITVQCELAKLGAQPQRAFGDWVGDELAPAAALDDIARLRKREARLLRQHRELWIEPLGRQVLEAGDVYFWRGFIDRVHWSTSTRIDDGPDDLFDAAPLLRSLDLGYVQAGSLNGLKNTLLSARMGRVEELDTGSIDDDGFLFLSESDAFTRLRRLCMGYVYDRRLTFLERTSFLPDLEALVLGSGPVATRLEPFLATPRRLRELQLGDVGLRGPRAKRLAELDSLRTLEVVAMRGNGLGQGGAGFLTDPGLPHLAALDLSTCKLGPTDGATIASLASLRIVDLGGNPLGDAGVSELTASRSLCVLRLAKVGMTDVGARAIATSPCARSLRVLDLRKNAITEDGAAALAASEHLGGVKVLYIGGNRLSDAGKQRLRESPQLKGARVHL